MKPALFLLCLLIILGWNGFLSTISTAFENLTHLSLQPAAMEFDNLNPLMLFITMSVFPGIVEELLFRGVLFRYLRKFGFLFGAVTSSLIFGLLHMNFLQFFFAFGIGFVFCCMYEKYGKLRYGMLLHIINNSIPVVYILLGLTNKAIMIAECVAAIIFIITLIILKLKKHFACFIKTDKSKLKSDIKQFFTTVPMIIFVVLMLSVCVFFMFIK